ncbi:MAG TPA: hypothetical protein DDY21_00250 [Candidatus Moranbacteria bacterium]|nr:hypothetical protein [Candidatus Moranbacteria bacterium]
MKILQKEKDLADKTRVWIEVAEGKAEMLKFQKDISDEEAMAEMQKVLDRRKVIADERNKEIDAQIAKLQAEKELIN